MDFGLKKILKIIFEKIKENKIASLVVFSILIFMFYRYVSFYVDVLSLPASEISLQQTTKSNNVEPNPDYVSTWGAYGDFIGGTLNPLLTFISIVFLAWTIIQNKESLKINSKELKLSRKANQISSKAQTAIEKTQSLQQFDSIFFSLLNQLNVYSEKLNGIEANSKKSILNYAYDSVFYDKQGLFPDRYLSLEQRRKELLSHKDLNQYFIFLYQLLKNTRDRLNENSSLKKNVEILKINYGNIVRASISPELLQLLVINILDEFKEYKNLVEEFRLFEHMPFTIDSSTKELNLPLLSALHYFPEKSFDKSVYYNELKRNSVFEIYFKKNTVDTIKKFEENVLNKLNGRVFKIYLTNYSEVVSGNGGKAKNNQYFLKIKDNRLAIYRDEEFESPINIKPKVVIGGLYIYVGSDVGFVINPENKMLVESTSNEMKINLVKRLNF